jgi:hypothetical protein
MSKVDSDEEELVKGKGKQNVVPLQNDDNDSA